MKKTIGKVGKIKILFSLSLMCLAIALLCFGVYSALDVKYSLEGEIEYEFQECHAIITTSVYKVPKPLDIREQNEIVMGMDTMASRIPTKYSLTQIGVGDSFSTLETSSHSKTNFNLDAQQNDTYAFVFVINVKNLSSNNVWAVVDSRTLSNSNVTILDNYQLEIDNSELGKNLVIVIAPSNPGKNFSTKFSFNVIVGSKTIKEDGSVSYNYVDSQTNLSKINISESNVVTKVSNNITGVVEIPGNCTLSSSSFDSSKITHMVVDNGQTTLSSFGSCSYLQSLSLPASVTSLPDYSYLRNLHRIFVDSNNTTYKSNKTCLINSANELVLGLATTIIPTNRVTSIADKAFETCSGLTSITIPRNITKIMSSAFYGCQNLRNVVIEDGVCDIYDAVFDQCSNLYNIALPESVTSIGEFAFNCCQKLERINLPSNLQTIKYRTFSESGLVKITIPSSVSFIESDSFAFCRNLVSVTIQNSSCVIDTSAFIETGLIYADITARGIGAAAFMACENLKYVTLHSVEIIGEEAFAKCYGLTNITIPESVTTILPNAFCDSSFSSVIFENVNGWQVDGKDITLSATDYAYNASQLSSYKDGTWIRS